MFQPLQFERPTVPDTLLTRAANMTKYNLLHSIRWSSLVAGSTLFKQEPHSKWADLRVQSRGDGDEPMRWSQCKTTWKNIYALFLSLPMSISGSTVFYCIFVCICVSAHRHHRKLGTSGHASAHKSDCHRSDSVDIIPRLSTLRCQGPEDKIDLVRAYNGMNINLSTITLS